MSEQSEGYSRGNHPNSRANLLKGKPWQPGQSGNPGGQAKFTRISEIIKGMLDLTPEAIEATAQREDLSLTVGDTIAARIIRNAMAGDDKAVRELLNRTEGKVPDEIIQKSDEKLTQEQALARYVDLCKEEKRIKGELLDEG